MPLFPLNRRLHSIPGLPQGLQIPKIIHQTFRTASLPDAIAANVAELRGMNPGWEYRFYDDDAVRQFIAEHYGDKVLRIYQRINLNYGATRADLFRYLLMYKVGGVYLDLKSATRLPLDDIIRPEDRFILSHWDKSDRNSDCWGRHAELEPWCDNEFQQWHIIAAPGHPFLKAVIQRVLGNIECYIPELHGTGAHGGLRVTGPIPYTLAIAPLLARHDQRLVENHEALGLMYSRFADRKQHRDTLGVHYSKLRTPVVEPIGLNKLVSAVYRTGRTVARSVVPQRIRPSAAAA